MRRSLLHFLIALLACMLCSVGGVQAAGVIVVTSDRGAVYGEVRDALLVELERGGVARMEVSVLVASELSGVDLTGSERPRLMVTLGAVALRQVLALELRLPVVAALIPRVGYEHILNDAARKSPPQVSALYLDQPFARQFELLRLALPAAKRVGVLWGPESISQQRNLTAIMQAQGLEPVHGTVGGDGLVFSGLKAALEDADVLLAVADPHVFNSSTISNILLATYRARIPVMAFSPAYVKAGALLSLHTTPSQIGTQAAAMARVMLQGGSIPGSQYPIEYVVSVNEHVARSLGLTVDGPSLAERLRRLEKRP